MTQKQLHNKLKEGITYLKTLDPSKFDGIYRDGLEDIVLKTEEEWIKSKQENIYKSLANIAGYCRITYIATESAEKSVLTGAALAAICVRDTMPPADANDLYPDINEYDYEVVASLGNRSTARMFEAINQQTEAVIPLNEQFYLPGELDYRIIGSRAMMALLGITRLNKKQDEDEAYRQRLD